MHKDYRVKLELSVRKAQRDPPVLLDSREFRGFKGFRVPKAKKVIPELRVPKV